MNELHPIEQSLWSLKSHKSIVLNIFGKLGGSVFVLLLCMEADFFQDRN